MPLLKSRLRWGAGSRGMKGNPKKKSLSESERMEDPELMGVPEFELIPSSSKHREGLPS